MTVGAFHFPHSASCSGPLGESGVNGRHTDGRKSVKKQEMVSQLFRIKKEGEGGEERVIFYRFFCCCCCSAVKLWSF